MKKLLLLGALIGITGTFLAPSMSFAQTTPTTQLQQIQNLMNQIKALQEQINKLQSQKQEILGNLTAALKEGDVGENVKTLQALLAADPDIYPEGLITGFFGKLTVKAVKKFQEKHGIESVGRVGPKTLEKLNKFLQGYPLAFRDSSNATNTPANSKNRDGDDDDEDDDDKYEHRLCAIVPPGHLIAKGWLKKNGQPIIPICQNLPGGILKKLGIIVPTSTATSTPTSTPDTASPMILTQTVVPSTSSAVVAWTTNETSDSQVYFGTSTAYGMMTTLDTMLVASHSQTLTGLASNTVYFYQVRSKDAAANLGTATGQFTTLSLPDTAAPIISGIGATSTASTSATIAWTTNEPATSKVYYGTANPLVLGSASTQIVSGLAASHSVPLSGLTASTTYYYVVESADAASNTATSTQSSFMTLGL